ncbi:putative mitochondrial catalytic subunit of the vacuolar transporter chaperone 4 [Leptomonas pyrrhocoris]|uniref:Putative mitochondrial catalytic subunit of the vacuolar transporter chaperone 4 n=1 Tax=Leptomonas pyrrhocoris TaxID=157538 RepID=A0A0M9FWS9_LEPPY|nr:putative mitochondrial catalytic subunit of the vacuolar transporter chaperone 4 [Leptomonas pyrrhocoris]XP_015655936.1 putative mitochondrial catalytic subunit of the vacuolar transporter chaperone 4 [Leptomonas pyrrhocoris]KPA77496.1 putative mitochondrial catalytic subunit of the vacuolar transporter chaperone 4 [Leptomonas pyrrhocoris]KPA77497.1 putative mitochondrial catalytic subunit of the vacuolar transporter chaperone 4 [Leptomonas pyrrhocoris]|eukprot:XP_015655935.1 putative mitochondrial catalytic subunit of the vacuolar transporter chaperone 4 [Leptomonas pyrrhocoris]
MPYSKAWRSAMYPDFRDAGAYVDYKATKEILHRMKENIANPSTPDELYHSLLEQKKRVYRWCEAKQAELLRVSRRLYESSEYLAEDEAASNRSLGTASLARGAAKSLPPREARLIADAIMQELLRFVECRNLNTDTMDHIIGRMYRYAVLGPTGDRWKNIYVEYNYDTISIEEVFCHLSRVYDRVTQTEERISAKGRESIRAGDVGSQVFDRRSVKYWVHPQDLPFVIARIIQHLPLSTFKDTYKDCKDKGVPFRLFSPVSSVYYDNSKFLFYHRRLERIEGSTLIRMRWYSDTYAEDWNAVEENENVFMEIKVHHEAWSGERSNKRRFAIKEKEVDAFVHAQLSLLPAVEKLKRKNASEAEQEKFKSLATEILSKIHAYDLKPALRTQCGRAAFQRGADQTVRVSIDTDLRVSAEDFGLDHHWRYTGGDSPVSRFPYAVVEIKLQCAENERIAPWIEELMGCRYMESIPKFSKYAHGIASLYGHTSFINMVPYWMHQLDIDIRASTKPETHHWDPTVGLAAGCLQRTGDRVIFGTNPAQTQTVGASEAQFMPRTDYAKVYQQVLQSLLHDEDGGNSASVSATQPALAPADAPAARNGDANGVPGHLIAAPVVQYSVDRRHAAYTTFHLYPYTETGTESLCYDPKDTRNAAATVFYGKIPWQTGKRIKVPQKYDPKTLLTSERYMVKWMTLATQLGLLGIASIRFGKGLFLPQDVAHHSPFWQGQFHVVIGVFMEVLALLTLLYAYVGFMARARRVYARRKIRFDDVVGPTWLTFSITLSFVLIVMTHIARRYGPMLTGSDSF